MRISRQPFPVKIMIDQKQLENVESLKYLGSMLTNDGRCTCELNVELLWLMLHLTRRGLFYQHNDLGVVEEACEVLHLERNFIWC